MEAELSPWHTALTRQIFDAAPIRVLISNAPSAIVLAEVWKLVCVELTAGRLTPNTGTLRKWKEMMGTRTLELMRADPRDALFVYNTLFTFFDGAARDALHVEFQKLIRDIPPNPSST